ncbi:hypothetical protein CVT25_015159 [Psilocybe cyanescens]|uniref:Uncharacterized protein n=1 Tax=Psilocybe cyanescens TaxID=93625 RepID=A0A409X209_PSICY|nr:hypothetical protein CVT25_015159 [Psilocybe cyanescens]
MEKDIDRIAGNRERRQRAIARYSSSSIRFDPALRPRSRPPAHRAVHSSDSLLTALNDDHNAYCAECIWELGLISLIENGRVDWESGL